MQGSRRNQQYRRTLQQLSLHGSLKRYLSRFDV